jgi:predicted NUDIX family NTP pyrophosphohydrolase
MPKTSAGILLYRRPGSKLEVLLVHPGGPFWARKNLGAWSLAKGEYQEGEDPLCAALREFFEETGHRPAGPFLPLGQRKQPSGKHILAWAAEGDWDPSSLVSNTFSMEWPRGSGAIREFPEVDRAEWFDMAEAQHRILSGQRGFLDDLHRKLVVEELHPPGMNT